MRIETPKTNGAQSPALFLTIANGAGHTRAAEAIAAATRRAEKDSPTLVADVADYMTALARFTHVTAYLWLVKNAPRVWERIDRHQKRQTQTSPEWYYREGCRKLFKLAREIKPRAIVATEVGCCEIAALIKRDLNLDAPLVAVNINYDSDRAWVQPEVDLYCAPTEAACAELIAHGAPPEKVMSWGVPMDERYAELQDAAEAAFARREVCQWLALDARRPVALVAGGSEGMGRIEEAAQRLLALECAPQVVVLTGRNAKLKARLDALRQTNERARKNLRALGWTTRVPELMATADVLVSKLGNTFDEALAMRLPLVALTPPPGSERVQHALLDEWNVGRAVRTQEEMCAAVETILRDENLRERMRANAAARAKTDAAERIAEWIAAASQSNASDVAIYEIMGRATGARGFFNELGFE